MSWNRYLDTALDGIDETEARSDRTWLLVLGAVVAWELWLRRRTVDRALRMPVVDGGWFDLRERKALRALRAGVAADVQTMQAALQREIGGGRDPFRPVPGGGTPRPGLSTSAISDTVEAFTPRWDRLQEIADAFQREFQRPLPPRPSRAPTPPPPPGLTPEQVKEIEQELAKRAKRPGGLDARELDDEFDVGQDALINIARNLGYDLQRVTETVFGRLTGPFSRPSAMVAFMNGSRDGQPWQLNRNHLRLSTTAHIRAAHRRRTVSEATAAGITHFRLDVPKSRLGAFAPEGITAKHVWQVRPLSKWQDLADRMNRQRIGASSFDTLGLGFGDVTYIVPVPAVFLPEAVDQGHRWRRRRIVGREAA